MQMHVAAVAVTLTLSPPILAMFTEVLHHAGVGPVEAAAFIVRDGNDIRCVFWPQTNEFHAATFAANPPDGVIAIVHTHPVEWPKPSDHDRMVALTHAIQVFAITPQSIYETDANGNVSARVRARYWPVHNAAPACVSSPLELERMKSARRVCVNDPAFDAPCDY